MFQSKSCVAFVFVLLYINKLYLFLLLRVEIVGFSINQKWHQNRMSNLVGNNVTITNERTLNGTVSVISVEWRVDIVRLSNIIIFIIIF